MKILREYEFQYNTEKGLVDVYVTESATNWYVTIKPVNYALPICLDWKVSKKESKNESEAFERIWADVKKRHANMKKF